jgi:hypothetical protein
VKLAVEPLLLRRVGRVRNRHHRREACPTDKPPRDALLRLHLEELIAGGALDMHLPAPACFGDGRCQGRGDNAVLIGLEELLALFRSPDTLSCFALPDDTEELSTTTAVGFFFLPASAAELKRATPRVAAATNRRVARGVNRLLMSDMNTSHLFEHSANPRVAEPGQAASAPGSFLRLTGGNRCVRTIKPPGKDGHGISRLFPGTASGTDSDGKRCLSRELSLHGVRL